MNPERFKYLEVQALGTEQGRKILSWADTLGPCTSARDFFAEFVWVVMCSGVREEIARIMERKYWETGVCRHKGKARAIAMMRSMMPGAWEVYRRLRGDAERLAFIRKFPYMRGKALCFQFAKNLGMVDFCKPDMHLCKLADERLHFPGGPQGMCEALADEFGITVAYVDTAIWFFCKKQWDCLG